MANPSNDRRQVKVEVRRKVDNTIPPDAWLILSGAAAFGSVSAISCFLQQRLLGLTTGSLPPLPTIAGMATVCAASLVSHRAAIATRQYQKYGRWPENLFAADDNNSKRRYSGEALDLGFARVPTHALRICVVGLLAFKVLGGRFWALSPSSFANIGSFARFGSSLPATENYATPAQRKFIETFGRWGSGCHTCGTRQLFSREKVKFVADHMPPKSVAERMNQRLWRRILRWKVKYRFYPQCSKCCSQQGGLLSQRTIELRNKHRSLVGFKKANQQSVSKSAADRGYFHALRPRINYLAGGVIAGISAAGMGRGDDAESVSRERYLDLQDLAEVLAYKAGLRFS